MHVYIIYMYIFIYIIINEKTNNIYTVKIFRLLPLSIHNLSLAEIYIHKYIYIYMFPLIFYICSTPIYIYAYLYILYILHTYICNLYIVYILHIYSTYIIYIIYYIHIYKIFIMKKTTHLNYQTTDYCKSINSFQDTTYTFNIRSFKFSLF